jgi:hypothetical protein
MTICPAAVPTVMFRLPVRVTVPLENRLFDAEIATPPPGPPGAAAERDRIIPTESPPVVPLRFVRFNVTPCEWPLRAAVVRKAVKSSWKAIVCVPSSVQLGNWIIGFQPAPSAMLNCIS